MQSHINALENIQIIGGKNKAIKLNYLIYWEHKKELLYLQGPLHMVGLMTMQTPETGLNPESLVLAIKNL